MRNSLLGTAIGDALGLPFENLPRERIARHLPINRFRLLFGRGMISDDTEHSCLTLRALALEPHSAAAFQMALAREIRRWFLALPCGLGFATLRACIKLCIGISPDRSGVQSAGNGPAMRAPILGAAIDDSAMLMEFVTSSARITHTDPRALHGALVVAAAARCMRRAPRSSIHKFLVELEREFEIDAELRDLLRRAQTSLDAGEKTDEFAAAIGLKDGVTGYMYHTVPIAIHASFAAHSNLLEALNAVIACGGDTDSTAAIVGGILGAGLTDAEIPEKLLAKLNDYPFSVASMKQTVTCAAQALIEYRSIRPPLLFYPALLLRNLLFFCVILSQLLFRWLRIF